MFSRLNSTRAILLTAAIGVAAAVATTQPAQAQFGQAVAISELMKPEFFNRDMIIFVEGLDLDSEQQVIIESMFENYRDDFEEGRLNLTLRFENMRSELNPEDPERVLKLVFAPFERWRAEREGIRNSFLQNVKLVLSDQQLAQWPNFEMRLLRDKSLDRGILSGEQLNIYHVLQDMRLDERTMMTIEPILNEYAVELDGALKARNEIINDTHGTMLQALQEQNTTKMLQVVDRQIDHRVAVRNINDHYVNAVAVALSRPTSEEFYKQAMERGYPRIFRRNSAEKLYEAVLEHEDVDPDIKSSVRELYDSYATALGEMNARLLEMIRAHEPQSERQRARAAAARMNNEPHSRMPNPAVVEFQKRDTMVRENVELLRWTVGEELFITLPGASRWMRPTKPPNSTRTKSTNAKGKFGTSSSEVRGLTSEPTGSSAGNDPAGANKSGRKPRDPDNPGPPDE